MIKYSIIKFPSYIISKVSICDKFTADEFTEVMKDYVDDCYKQVFAAIIKTQQVKTLTTRCASMSEFVKPIGEATQVECDHHYRQYIGLTEQFEYCTKCDERKV